MHKACRRCHFPVVKELLSFVKRNNADPGEFVRNTNSIGETALHYAARVLKNQQHFPGEDAQIITLLMQNGSDVFMQTETVARYMFKVIYLPSCCRN
jgi:ankyrin repeat protein